MNELIESHLGYAHAIAADLVGKYPPHITRDDLESAAELGLVQAARSYDPSRSVSFATFAYYRVRGAIFDEVRKSWHAAHPKSGTSDYSSAESAQSAPHLEMFISCDELNESDSSSVSNYLISLDSDSAEQVSTTAESPDSHVLKKEEAKTIKDALKQLPERHRFVLEAHYYEELSLVSIGKQLKLSKSWVSRIHAQALLMVRGILKDSQRKDKALQTSSPICRQSAKSPSSDISNIVTKARRSKSDKIQSQLVDNAASQVSLTSQTKLASQIDSSDPKSTPKHDRLHRRTISPSTPVALPARMRRDRITTRYHFAGMGDCVESGPATTTIGGMI